MDTVNKIDEIRQALSGYVGRRVHVSVKKGRRMRFARYGILEHAYSNIFVVLLDRKDGDDTQRRISFSYADVLTRTVEIIVFKSTSSENEQT